MSENKYIKLIKYGAWYDLFLTSILALPIIAGSFLGLFQSTDTYLNLIGNFQNFEPIHIMFVNLMGIISVFWALLRIKHTTLLLGLYDSYMRLGIAIILVIYMLFFNVSLFFISFFLFEFILGVVQLYLGRQVTKKTK